MQKNKLHIVWVLANNTTAPYFNSFANIAYEKKEIRLSFICMCLEKPKMIEEMKSFGFDCHWIKYDYNKRKRGLIRSTVQLCKLFKRMKPDVIHSHLFDDSLASMIAGKLVGIKKRIVTKGDTGFHYNYKRQWVIFDKIINLLATRIVSISSESQKFIIEKEKANANKVVLIHHGLPLIKTTLQIEEIKNKFIGQWNLKNKIVIGTISRFIDWKGYRNIVNAAEVIVRKHPNAIFLFVGEGEKKKEIIEIVTSKKLSQNIVFSDWINPDYIPSLFGVMNIFLHAAKYEPFGLVIAEAMLNGVPVVATKTGAALDAIDHLETGYLCDYDSINDIQEGLEFMILDMKNPKIGENGKIKAEKLFAIEVMYENHLKIYN